MGAESLDLARLTNPRILTDRSVID